VKYLHDNTEVEASVPTKTVNGKTYVLSEQELYHNQQLQSQHIQTKPMRNWQRDMLESDRIMTRAVEDIIAHLGVENMPAPLQEKYQEKIDLRAQQPADYSE